MTESDSLSVYASNKEIFIFDGLGIYKRDIDHFNKWVIANNLVDVKNEFKTIEKYILQYSKIETRNKKVKAFICLYKNNIKDQFLFDIKRKEVMKLKLKTKETLDVDNYMTKEEIESFISYLNNVDDTIESKRTRKDRPLRLALIIEVLFVTGLRINELTTLKLSDIEIVDNFVNMTVIGKGSFVRMVTIKKELYESVLSLFESITYFIENIKHKRYNNDNIHRLIKHYFRKAYPDGLPTISTNGRRIKRKDIGLHTFRHSFAIHLKNNGVPVHDISKYLGHSDISITSKRYFNKNVDVENILNKF